jgi:LysR family glycine cleavage system transcriptional activator
VSSFDTIEHHFAMLRGKSAQRPLCESHQDRLTVTTTETFATGWLIPRIGPFLSANTDIDLPVEATRDVVNIRNDTRIDLAIRHSVNSFEGMHYRSIFAARLAPVISPSLLNDKQIAGPEDLLSFTSVA